MRKAFPINHFAGRSEQWLADFLESAAGRCEIVSLIALGSSVRSRSHRRSDFDLLVVYEGDRPKIKAPSEIDIRFLKVGQIKQHFAAAHEILLWALMFGVVLHDPDAFWTTFRNEFAHNIPLPSAAEARRRAEDFFARAENMNDAGDDHAADDLILAALTQFVRERLLVLETFPASRPELADQLRHVDPGNRYAELLEQALYESRPAAYFIDRICHERMTQAGRIRLGGPSLIPAKESVHHGGLCKPPQ